MTPPDAANTYLRNKVLTASREELRLLLLDGAIKFAHMAKEGLERKDFEQAYSGFGQCRAIVVELLSTIQPEHNPEVAEKVQGVFTFLFSELVKASAEKDAARVATVIELLEYERETWELLMDQIAKERSNGSASVLRATGMTGVSGYGSTDPRTGRGGLSIQG